MQIRKVIVWVLLAAVLAGCTGRNGNTDATVATEVTTEPTVVETTVTTEPEEPVLEAVNVLAYRSSDGRPEVCPLDGRTAAFLTVETDKSDYSKKQTRVQVWDLYTDAMIAEEVLDGALSVLDQGGCTGYIALTGADNTIVVLNRDLKQELRFSCDDVSGALSADLSTYYYLYGCSLYSMDIASGETAPVQLNMELAFHEIQSYDVQENVLLMTAYVDPYTTSLCIGAVDLDSGELVLLVNDTTGGAIADGGVCLETYNMEGMYSDAAYLDWDEGVLRTLPEFMPNDGAYSTWHIPGSDYVCKVTFDAIQKDKAVSCDLYRLEESLTVCSLAEVDEINAIVSLPDGNLLALEVGRRGYQPYLICPELLEFTEVSTPEAVDADLVDETIAENYEALLNVPLAESMSNARQMADALEEKHGVTILLSAECATAVSGSPTPIQTTDLAQMPNEAGAIEAALVELEAVLALYPEDFFYQFQNEAGERGLLILLVEGIATDRNTIGLTYEMGQWYPIAVDITTDETANIYAHEIWHATENRINAENTDLLSAKNWDPCNPDGYVYSYDGTAGYIFDTDYTFFYERNNANIYFVDQYGKTNPYEDRARIMEYIMVSDYASEMADIPALRAKLRIMSDAIRQVFDTENWGEVYWERFF